MTGTGVKQLPDIQVNLKVKLEFTIVLLNPELTIVLLKLFLKTLDPDQLVSFRGHLIIQPYIQLNDTGKRVSQRLRQLQASNDVYKYSFYPRTISDWNRLPTTVTDVQTLQEFREGSQVCLPSFCDPTRLSHLYIVLTGDLGYFTCFIGHRSFYTG